ncbi:MAG: DivIVA domain-containing protein [Microlunatus sp.]|nr:DivIVA domain-containing protein [Microlunatus sp.]
MNDVADWSPNRPHERSPEWSPRQIRDTQFDRRRRGYDEAQVSQFQAAVADQISRLLQHQASLRAQVDELARSAEQQELRHQEAEAALNAEISRLTGAADNGETKERAVQLLMQAQNLADQLVNEAVEQTRDMMVATRAHIRELRVVSDDHAASASPRAAAAAPVGQPTGDAGTAYVHTYAGIAALQLRAVVDALSEQITKLGELASRPSPEAPDLDGWNRGNSSNGWSQADAPRIREAE